eukprot:Plantae.Rhodophyta-Purpureofilum_apyrenoidigerum.ctg3489.p1 GENE.Plantae.Rhodophyta-Purpureofilum_apyrenoidigerum.ctg3489~~Plantae.Rhodophyta-Purpureofilum_apyrenoidigerum.ctg3489.p1  ORF type:complete len:300 (+),score=78.27 Plantae.Rhodophyta-Purpureofilum_apyrenoidigerum.ctg3489:170-1069(+)
MESLTPDGGVRKRTEVHGEGAKPGANARVYCHYTLRESGGKVLESSRDKVSEFSFRLGKNKVVPGIEMLIRTMSPGEVAVAELSGNYVPPRLKTKKNIEAEVRLLRAEDAESKKALLRMTPQERLDAARKCKEQGNDFFKEAKYGKAMKEYQNARDYLQYVFYESNGTLANNGSDEGDENDDEEVDRSKLEEMVNKVKVSTFNNLALCYAKDGSNTKVIHCANEVLSIEPNNPKALYHRGMANTNIGNTDEARLDLTKAAKLNPTDARIRNELLRLEKKIVSDKKREKRAYGAMFASEN